MKIFMELMDGDWLTDIECAEVSTKPISGYETVEPAYTNPLTGISVYVG